MSVITRFAPSPTGMLHIGGVRTALLNQLFAQHHGGKYKLRIEDTDQKRSTSEAVQAILSGLEWLGLLGDDEVVYQSQRLSRHQQVAHELLQAGKAYYCDCTPERLAQQRAQARQAGQTRMYDRHCRTRKLGHGVVRIAMPTSGDTVLCDAIQGEICIDNDHLDDYVILRSDGSPTYMLSCVVDDGDMGITHVIRGDDHLVNAFRQYHLLKHAGYATPTYAHVSLLHGADGAKLSKRHGALGIEHYQQAGYLADALCNYLMRLGWGHGEEILSRHAAAKIFALEQVSKSPARLDFERLEYFNAHYIRDLAQKEPEKLVDTLQDYNQASFSAAQKTTLALAMPGLSKRATRLDQLWEMAQFYLTPPSWPLQDSKSLKQFMLKYQSDEFAILRETMQQWSFDSRTVIQQQLEDYVEARQIGFGQIGQPMRVALSGTMQAPEIHDIIFVLGQQEVIARLCRAEAWVQRQT